ncbi:MAG TPA: di-heme oxidoredictase family protein [Verrucomicrobiae bacterium]|nr:di-heme oxidoredictase family protein [Verrucomicrobiae bacterium]
MRKYGLTAIAAALLLAPVVVSQDIASPDASRNQVRDPGVRGGPANAGQPIAGLLSYELAAFKGGQEAFEEANFVRNPPPNGDAGLGPRFNSDSCVSCHAQPAVGGTSPFVNPQIEVATKNGARNRIPPFLSINGPVREVRFIRNADGTPDGGVHSIFVITGRRDAQGCRIEQDDFSNASNLSFRIPTPLFGAGLMEQIQDEALIANLEKTSGLRAALGIKGELNRNDNTGTITRFGWKAQVASLHIFAGEAYNVEQGVSNQVFPSERDDTEGCRFNSVPEDVSAFEDTGIDDITLFAAFMRFLAPPDRGPVDRFVTEGASVFLNLGCALCHTPSLQTSNSTVPALRNKPVPLYSDLALHHMGPGLADHISQGRAGGDEFRTAPLWGLGKRIFFLHDGRTNDLVAAIQAHASPARGQYPASEANAVIQRFNASSSQQKQSLLNFLRSL